jgi:hypothetical protein
VLLTIPWWVLRYRHQVEIAPIASGFAGLLRTLPAATDIVITTHAQSETALWDWNTADVSRPIHVIAVADDLTFTVWAQDACVVRVGLNGLPCLVAPAGFDRHDDARLMDDIARHLGTEHERAALYFQGGNVLVGDDFWLVGADSIRETVERGLAGDPAAAQRAFAAQLDGCRTLHVIGSRRAVPAAHMRARSDRSGGRTHEPTHESIHGGNSKRTRQPMFDLDGFISLAGRDADGTYRVLVGDPRLAARLMSRLLPDHALTDVFDDVAEQLVDLGFRVIRNPLPLVFHDDRVKKTRVWYFASSNNVLVEIDGAARNVWLPSYADDTWPELASTDRRNTEIWEDLGFTVHGLPSFHAFAQSMGAVRCMCKCLTR